MFFASLTLNLFCRRAICVLLLAAFLVPTPTPTHAEEIRALYAAQGLLCVGNEDRQRHHDAHCVLCLLAEVDSAPKTRETERPLTFELVVHSIAPRPLSVASVGSHRARAPPFRFV